VLPRHVLRADVSRENGSKAGDVSSETLLEILPNRKKNAPWIRTGWLEGDS
jgi:hypothetical protein